VIGVSLIVVCALVAFVLVRPAVASDAALTVSRPAVSQSVVLLPDALDLLALAVASGLNVADSLDLVARFGPAALAGQVRPIVEAIDTGRPVISALHTAGSDPRHPFGIVLAALGEAHVNGTAIEIRLISISADLRGIARSREQTAARKLSVRLLLPLVLCMLPAFALLTIVPVLIEALG